jgi:hypothetical protein
VRGRLEKHYDGSMSALKKTLFHPKADPVARVQFQTRVQWHEGVEKRPIVYLDESGFAVDAPRTHGYSLKGKRCYDQKDWHAKGRLNAIGAMMNFALLTVQLWECNIDSDVFLAWVKTALLPSVPMQSVIVLDGASFHKRSDIRRTIEQRGHILEFLPSYSPDLNPIEKKWAQAKAVRRQHRCSPTELFSLASDYAVL